MMTFLTRPVTWYKNKLQYLDNLWYGNDWKSEAMNKTLRFLQGVVIFLSAAFYYIYYLVKWRKTEKSYRDLYIASLVFLIFNVMLFTMLHFEMRYSIFLKLVFITMLVLILHDFIRAYLARRQE